MFIVGAVAGFVILGAVQWWFVQSPRARAMQFFTVVFPIAWVILSSLVIAGIVGLVVSVQLGRERRRTVRVSEIERLVRLHGQGLIDDEELASALHNAVQQDSAKRGA